MKPSVLLINPSQNTKYPQPPMGLVLLGAILEKEGYKVRIFDMNERGWTKGVRINILRGYSRKVDVIGVTAMTPTVNTALEVIRQAKNANPNIQVILGGVHATLLPFETMAESKVDTLVVGEGDKAILEVLENDIKGVYKNDTQIDMDDLPYLAYHLLSWQDYRPHPPHGRELPFLPMITSRGCPYHCSYCSKGVFGNKFRAQSPLRVIEEVTHYKNYFQVKEIGFYDDVFTLDRKRAYGIADELLKSRLKIIWTCETRANLVDKELLRHMKKAGCYSIAYGIESASQDILDIIDKDISLEQVEEAISYTREAGIQTIGYFMIGSPNETPETIRQTIGFAKKLKLDYVQFSVTTPFPNTKLYDYYKDDGKENVDWDSYVYAGIGNKTRPVFENDFLKREDIEFWVSKAYKEFYMRPPYIWQRLRGVKSLGDAKLLVKGLNMLRGM